MRAHSMLLAAIAGFAALSLDTRTLDGISPEQTPADAAPLPAVAGSTESAVAAIASVPITVSTPDDWGSLDDAIEELDEDVVASSDSDEPAAPTEGLPVLVSIAHETWIFAEPRWRSRRLGYLRAGAIVKRAVEPESRRGCSRGWYRIEPRGFVCAKESAASLDALHPVALLSSRRPDMRGLPYLYATSRFPPPPLYARLPSEAEQRLHEPDVGYKRRQHARLKADPDYVEPPAPDPVPELMTGGKLLPGLGDQPRGETSELLGYARVRSGFAMLGTYEHLGRRFGLTTELALVPLDGLRMVSPSTLRGVHLSDELTLPIAIVTSRHAEGALPWRSIVPLTGNERRSGGQLYLEAMDGSYVRADRVVRVDGFSRAPGWAKKGRKWIDVSILRQTLVAYEGERPVYATLVSTGADGLADHEESHATIQGTFLIHTKHVTVTMDGEEEGDEFDLRDVPFVQYFTEGYALHGAYWHDDFGRPRSHGCVNLAPLDAAWLFGWSDPKVPTGWHAALSLREGTIVHVHP